MYIFAGCCVFLLRFWLVASILYVRARNEGNDLLRFVVFFLYVSSTCSVFSCSILYIKMDSDIYTNTKNRFFSVCVIFFMLLLLLLLHLHRAIDLSYTQFVWISDSSRSEWKCFLFILMCVRVWNSTVWSVWKTQNMSNSDPFCLRC